jgi:hypothetical protein
VADAPVLKKITTRTITISASGNDPAHDEIELPSRVKVKDATTDQIRQECSRLEIPNCWTLGRAELVGLYVELVEQVFNEAGRKALDAWLTERGK